MSEVINPPDYYFTGINFNPAFYADTGLSESTANALYLRKTVPDTATANETFLADINCEGGIFVFDSIATTNAIVSLESFPDDPTIQLTSGSLGTMTIKSNSLEVEASRPLNIGTNTNVDLNLGGITTNIALGALTGAGTTTLNKPLTPAYAYPVASTTIGYRVLDPILSVNLASNTFTELTNAITLPVGLWLINYSMRLIPAGTSSITNLTMWGEETANPTQRYAQNGTIVSVTTNKQILYSGSFTVIGTGSNSYRIRTYAEYSGNTIGTVITPTNDFSTIIRTRIA